jgi:hypothetical protein
MGVRAAARQVTIEWPSGGTQEFANVQTGAYECVEGASLRKLDRY